MAKLPKPFVIEKRKDSRTFRLTINFTSGLPERVCAEWRRRSFQDFPDELAHYRYPKKKSGKFDDSAAEAGAIALIAYLKKKLAEGGAMRVKAEDITVGKWIEKFTAIETSLRTGINASKNKPYSYNTLDGYKGNFERHIKDDPICELKMAEIEEADILEYMTRLSVKKLEDGRHTVVCGNGRFYEDDRQ